MKGLEMVKCESLRINMFRITHTGKSVNFPVTCPWFNCVASLHRPLTGLHPIDICFLNDCFHEFLAVLFS